MTATLIPNSLHESVIGHYLLDNSLDFQAIRLTYVPGKYLHYTPYALREGILYQADYCPCHFYAEDFHKSHPVVKAIVDCLGTEPFDGSVRLDEDCNVSFIESD